MKRRVRNHHGYNGAVIRKAQANNTPPAAAPLVVSGVWNVGTLTLTVTFDSEVAANAALPAASFKLRSGVTFYSSTLQATAKGNVLAITMALGGSGITTGNFRYFNPPGTLVGSNGMTVAQSSVKAFT